MKAKTSILFLCIGALCSSSGCKSSTPNSVGDSNGELALNPSAISADNSSRRVPQKTEIKLMLLEQFNLVGKHPESKAGAYFIQVDDDEVRFFSQHFEGNVPRVDVIGSKDKEFPNMRQDERGVVTDTKTGKQAEVFQFDKIEIKGNQATVEMSVAYSSMAIVVHAYTLTRELGKWVVHSHTTRAVS
jgi:hypothetical protein